MEKDHLKDEILHRERERKRERKKEREREGVIERKRQKELKFSSIYHKCGVTPWLYVSSAQVYAFEGHKFSSWADFLLLIVFTPLHWTQFEF